MRLLPSRVPGGVAWLVLDQVASMSSNLVVTIALVRRGDATLGAFAAVAATLTVVLAVQRAVVSEPAAAARRPATGADEAIVASSLLVLVLGATCGAVAAVVGLLAAPALLPLAVALPFLTVQDNLRYMSSRQSRPQVAVAMDGFWLVALVCVLVALPAADGDAVVWAWALCGSASLVAGSTLLRRHRARLVGLRAAVAWWRRECGVVARATGVDMVLSQTYAQVVVFIVIGLLGLGAAGQYRAGQSLFGGCLAATIALNMYLLPRMRERGSSLSVVAWLGSRYLLVVGAVGVVTLAVNRPVQELVFGRVVVSTSLAAWLLVLFLSMALSSSQAVALRVDAGARQRLLLTSRLTMLVVGVLAVVLATRTGSLPLVVAAQAGGMLVFVALTFAGLRPSRVDREPLRSRRALSPFTVHLAAVRTPGVDALYCAARGLSANRPDAATDLVVEGYPRSANTYVKAAFLHANPGARVASHLHTARSVRRAVRLGVPTVVLVRDPLDAAASLLVRDRRVTEHAALSAYRAFYAGVVPVLDDVVVVEFGEATTQFGAVIERVNERYHRDFAPYLPDDATDSLVAAEVEQMERDFAHGVLDENAVARPSAQRTDAVRAVRTELAGPAHAQLVAECYRLHREVLARARAVSTR